MLHISKNRKVTRYSILISPIYCCVIINHKSDGLLNGDIFLGQSYLDSNCINFNFFFIPGCLLIHLDIIIQHRQSKKKIERLQC